MLIIIYFVLFASVITIMIKSEFFDHSKCEKINSLSGQQPEHSSIKFLSVKEYTL